MAATQKKINNFKSKLQKTKQKIISRGNIPNHQQTRKKNRRYSKEKRRSKIKRNKKYRKIIKKKDRAEIKKNIHNQNAINLTNIAIS